MNEYIQAVGAAVILSALIDIIAPEGDFKKYCRLACGFVVIAVVIAPAAGGLPEPADTAVSYDSEEAELLARTRILEKHSENLEEILESRFPPCEASVEVDSQGNVTGAAVSNAPDTGAVRDYIRSELGLEGEGVKINENNGNAQR